jgi:transposase
MQSVGKYRIRLTSEEREKLEAIAKNGQNPAKKITHARILLMRDEVHGNGGWKDQEIAQALGIHRNQIFRVCKRFVREGEAPALNRRIRETPPTEAKLDGAKEAQLIAICCSQAPEGQARWSLSLLVGALQQRGVVASISRETVRKTLKKMNFNLGGRNVTASQKEI